MQYSTSFPNEQIKASSKTESAATIVSMASRLTEKAVSIIAGGGNLLQQSIACCSYELSTARWGKEKKKVEQALQ